LNPVRERCGGGEAEVTNDNDQTPNPNQAPMTKTQSDVVLGMLVWTLAIGI
jgi:hypothetical protein